MTAVLAPPMYADDFVRANSTSLGLYWTESGGDLGIISNLLAVQGTTAGRRAAIYNVATQTPWQTVQFTVGSTPNTSAGCGAVLRCNVSITEMFILSVASNGWALGRMSGGINGTFTTVGSVAVAITTGTVIRVSVDIAGVWRVYVNGILSGTMRDTNYADMSHLYHGAFVQRASSVNSASVAAWRGWDTPPLTLVDSDGFDRVTLGAGWTPGGTGGGGLYIDSGELSGVGQGAAGVSYILRDTPVSAGRTNAQVARARVRWHGRNPAHSVASVGVRADSASGHSGAHFWFCYNLMGICIYGAQYTDGFLAATGTDTYVSTTKFGEGAIAEIRAEGPVFVASVDSVPVLVGTFTDTQVPITNRQHAIQIQDDSSVSGGGEPPANLDDFASYIM